MAEVNKTFRIKQGDLLPILRGRIRDRDTGEPQDLSVATLEFHMSSPDTGEVLVTGIALAFGDQNDPDDTGWWEYTWQPGDTGPYSDPGVDETLTFNGEIQATISGKPLTAPNDSHFKIKMRNQLA
jgi:hypothetical protein